MAEVNKHGLSRYIPAHVKREVRQRSKFGCVICRCGLYQYEHIDPLFVQATEHNPECICCLCGSCHELVTRGHFSKEFVKAKYSRIQKQPMKKVGPPVGPLDFHDGNVELVIGGLLYSPAVRTILRYNGSDLIRIFPSTHSDEPGRISAILTDDKGVIVLRLEENEWIGSIHSWDIEIAGPQLTIRRENRSIVLQLRLDPPGRIVVEHLDMRIHDAHIIATEKTYAVGRYLTDKSVNWVYANIRIHKSSPYGVAIEFTDPKLLEERDIRFSSKAQELATDDRKLIMNSNVGILVKPLGVAIASFCGDFDIGEAAGGNRNIDDMRQIIFNYPEKIGEFIGTGKISG